MVGQGPVRHLEVVRRVLERGTTIHQVACTVGYRDLGHFDRVFRRWEGQTPSRYRCQGLS
ncbi:MAG: helix-turn-helix domain-containing protein [candidate division NC10 bacterium]|nr:helix-turn-helix domain-containing protein [candidate division NC10 bacterium]